MKLFLHPSWCEDSGEIGKLCRDLVNDGRAVLTQRITMEKCSVCNEDNCTLPRTIQAHVCRLFPENTTATLKSIADEQAFWKRMGFENCYPLDTSGVVGAATEPHREWEKITATEGMAYHSPMARKMFVLGWLMGQKRAAEFGICVYCGQVSPNTTAGIIDHIMACKKNPAVAFMDELHAAYATLEYIAEFRQTSATFDAQTIATEAAARIDNFIAEQLATSAVSATALTMPDVTNNVETLGNE